MGMINEVRPGGDILRDIVSQAAAWLGEETS